MSAINGLEVAVLRILLQNEADAVWDGLTSATSLHISLHTADPGETGSQNSSEATYTGYTRMAIDRNADAWQVTTEGTNSDQVTFPVCTANPGDPITHFGVGLSASGAGTLYFYSQLAVPITMAEGTAVLFRPGAMVITCD